MKYYYFKGILFLNFIVLILCGIKGSCLKNVVDEVKRAMYSLRYEEDFCISEFKNNVEKITNNDLSYHDFLMDLNSVKNNVLGVRVVQKEDSIIVKSEGDSLTVPWEKRDEKEIEIIVKRIQKLKKVSEYHGVNFCYCIAPRKELYYKSPPNVENNYIQDYKFFLSELKKNDIPYIDLSEKMSRYIENTEVFYYTDHHWKTYSGFIAFRVLCEELSNIYDFSYNKQYIDINNYDVEGYNDWFLGSYGRKTGTFFTWHGADDFELITPKFNTYMIEEQPFKGEVRSGNFENTVMFMENMKKDYYHINTYATYSGGDYRLQIMKNELNNSGTKVLLIRDSFSCVVAPFLALQTEELHICDIRDNEKYVGEKINIEKYIEEIKPDFVLVLYSGIRDLEDYMFSI